MRWIEKQDRVEQEVYSAIDELSEEFGLDVSYYPEVYWIGKTLDFKDVGLPKESEDEFDERFFLKISFCDHEHNSIIINRYRWHDIFEESSHFIHLDNSGVNLNLSSKGILWKNIYVEMIGFFGARVLGSNARNGYLDYEDLMPFYSSEKERFYFNGNRIIQSYGFDKEGFNKERLNDFFVYQQGYGLGEALFHNYIFNNIKRREIRSILTNDLSKKDSAKDNILELRERFWPIKTLS